MTPSETAKYLFERLIAAGITTEGACAILGNIQAESGFLPNNLENSLVDLCKNSRISSDSLYILLYKGFEISSYMYYKSNNNPDNYLDFQLNFTNGFYISVKPYYGIEGR